MELEQAQVRGQARGQVQVQELEQAQVLEPGQGPDRAREQALAQGQDRVQAQAQALERVPELESFTSHQPSMAFPPQSAHTSLMASLK